jgi:2-keto-3-deoxy-6-phosphogluconate aldolase
VGGELVDTKSIAIGDYASITQRARQFVEKARQALTSSQDPQ